MTSCTVAVVVDLLSYVVTYTVLLHCVPGNLGLLGGGRRERGGGVRVRRRVEGVVSTAVHWRGGSIAVCVGESV